jgi:hypothetical protein
MEAGHILLKELDILDRDYVFFLSKVFRAVKAAGFMNWEYQLCAKYNHGTWLEELKKTYQIARM